MTYSLNIRRCGIHENIESYDALIDRLVYYGLPLEIADFSKAVWDKYGMAKNSYRDSYVVAYQ